MLYQAGKNTKAFQPPSDLLCQKAVSSQSESGYVDFNSEYLKILALISKWSILSLFGSCYAFYILCPDV
jgi:hypothetical protein